MKDQGSMKQHPGGTGFDAKRGNWARQRACTTCSVRGRQRGFLGSSNAVSVDTLLQDLQSGLLSDL